MGHIVTLLGTRFSRKCTILAENGVGAYGELVNANLVQMVLKHSHTSNVCEKKQGFNHV